MTKTLFTMQAPPSDDIKEGDYRCTYRTSYQTAIASNPPTTIVMDKNLVATTRMLQVVCPHCDAPALSWCVKPITRFGLRYYEVLHIARWHRSFADGIWSPSAELVVPQV